jgi:putative endonuclease
MERNPCVYLLASRKNGTLYVGVTSNLVKRVWEHREHIVEGFTSRYHVTRLVWFEQHASMADAIAREKMLKHWKRQWKIRLIEERNPQWLDLYDGISGS